jgi:ubiquinone/menaquinone biosynthesis C-methylase UbiE
MHWFVDHVHHREQGEAATPYTRGLVLDWAWLYDRLMWFVTYGREQTFRHMIVDQAQLHPGETVLDVGCGTGTLAIVAKERVGATGRVSGIDAAPRMIALARRKAARGGCTLDFQVGLIEQLAFPDQSFDVVLSTFMMHHLPDDLKRQGLAEIVRVLKPEGHLLVTDFNRPQERQSQPEQFGVGEMGVQDLPALMKEAGFSQTETGEILFPIRSLGRRRAGHQTYGFVRARKSPVEEKRRIV